MAGPLNSDQHECNGSGGQPRRTASPRVIRLSSRKNNSCPFRDQMGNMPGPDETCHWPPGPAKGFTQIPNLPGSPDLYADPPAVDPYERSCKGMARRFRAGDGLFLLERNHQNRNSSVTARLDDGAECGPENGRPGTHLGIIKEAESSDCYCGA